MLVHVVDIQGFKTALGGTPGVAQVRHLEKIKDGRQNTYAIISGSTNDREVISVSRIWFSGSRNSNKIKSILFDHHVTLLAVLVKVASPK